MMEKLYEKIFFENKPSTATPLGKTILTKLDEGIDNLDNRIIEMHAAMSKHNIAESEQMAEAIERIRTLEGISSDHDSRISAAEGNIESLQTAVSDVENKVSEVEDKAYENYELIYSLREESKEAIEQLQEADNNIAKSISDISDELATLSQDKASAITETSKGESISAKGTVGGNNIQLLGIHGKYEQDSTTGEQLVDIADFELVKPATRTKSFDVSLLSAGTYHINIGLSGTAMNVRVKTQYVDDGGTVVNDTDYAVLANGDNVLTSSYDFNRLYFFIAIEQADGSTASISDIMLSIEPLPYEKYTGRKPAPNTDYPQEIKKSVISEVKTHRKNHLDCRGLSEFVSTGFTFTPVYKDESKEELLYINVNGTWDTSSTATNVRMKLDTWYPKETGNYVLSGLMTYLGTGNMLCLDKNGESGGYEVQATTSKEFTVAEDVEFYDVWLRIQSGMTVNNEKIYPMIRKADIADATYEPYTESVATLSSHIELGGIGDVADVLSADGIKRRFATVVFDGSENWVAVDNTSFSSEVLRFYVVPDGLKANAKLLCDSLIVGDLNNSQTRTIENIAPHPSNANINVFINASRLNGKSASDFKSWLAANPITVVYELADPTTEELPTADQIALNGLKSFDGVTYVETDSEVKPTIEAEFVLDTKAYIDRKFAELQSVLTAE